MTSELSLAEENHFLENFNFSLCTTLDEELVANISELSEICHMYGRHTPLPAYIMTVIQIFYGLVCVLGLVGNSLVIYVVLRFSKMHTVTNTYILHLAVADECFLLGIPFLIATMSFGQWPFGSTGCKIYFATTSINQITSSLFLMVLSADRYVAVRKGI